MDKRNAKISSIIFRSLSEIIKKTPAEFNHPVIEFISVSSDARFARVWLSRGLTSEKVLNVFIKKNRAIWQKKLARTTRLRYTPRLKFFVSDASEVMAKVGKIFSQNDF